MSTTAWVVALINNAVAGAIQRWRIRTAREPRPD